MGLVRPPIVFYAFDLLRLNGQDLRSLPIEEREAKLAALLKRPPADIRYSASFTHNRRASEQGSRIVVGRSDRQTRRMQVRFEAIRRLDQDLTLPAGFIRDRRLYPTCR
jgi:hypothetical protein